MIELHTKINCECGQSYHAMVVTDLPLNQKVERTTFCPFCGRPNDYKYKFSCDFTCKSKWKFWKKHFQLQIGMEVQRKSRYSQT